MLIFKRPYDMQTSLTRGVQGLHSLFTKRTIKSEETTGYYSGRSKNSGNAMKFK